MTKNEILSCLIEMVKGLLQTYREKDLAKVPDITFETDIFDDLGIDSLEILDLIDAIEKKFAISIQAEEISEKKTMGDIVDYILKARVSK